MEESLDKYFHEYLKVEYKNPNEYSPLALAYIGDSVFDLIVKTIIVAKNNMQAHKYHVEVSRLVKAGAQADYIDRIWPELNETEQDIYKRGRNTKTHSTAKNASVGQYRKATGFETLIGYLYLKQEYDRLFYLVSRIFDQSDENNRERTKIDGIKQ